MFVASGPKFNRIFFFFFFFLSIGSLFGISLHVLLGTAEAELLVAGTRDKQSVIFRLEVASLETSIEAGL